MRAGLAWFSVLLDFRVYVAGWALALPKIFLTDAARGLGLVFHVAGLGRCAVDVGGRCCARAWLSFPCCWAGCTCRCAGRSCCQRSFCLVLFVGLDRVSTLLGWVAVLLLVVAVATRALGLVFYAAGLGVRVAGLDARVAKYLSVCFCVWA